nr:hypothetical protein [Tanacetum cinerariifolium]
MYYPRFTMVIINFFMTKDPSIPRRNKEYHAIASGAAPPKTKASVRKKQSSSDTIMPPPTAASTRLLTSAKGKQPAKSYKAKASRSGRDEGTGIIPGVPDVPTDESDEEISCKSSDEDADDNVDDESDAAAANDDDDQQDEDEQDDVDQDDNDDDQESDNDIDDFVHPKLSTHDKEAKDEESFDLIVQTPSHVEDSDDESNDDESHGMNVGGDERPDAKDDDEELYRDVNINLEGIDSLSESTPRLDVHVTTTVVPLLVTTPTLPLPSIPIMSQVQQAPALTPITSPSTSLQDLPNFGSLFGFDHRLKTLEANFSKLMQINQFAKAVSSILGIVDRYIDHRMNEAVKVAVRLQSDRLRDEAQAENKDFINKLDESIQKIIKEKFKKQVKVQVSKILPKIEKTVNEQLEAEVLT